MPARRIRAIIKKPKATLYIDTIITTINKLFQNITLVLSHPQNINLQARHLDKLRRITIMIRNTLRSITTKEAQYQKTLIAIAALQAIVRVDQFLKSTTKAILTRIKIEPMLPVVAVT